LINLLFFSLLAISRACILIFWIVVQVLKTMNWKKRFEQCYLETKLQLIILLWYLLCKNAFKSPYQLRRRFSDHFTKPSNVYKPSINEVVSLLYFLRFGKCTKGTKEYLQKIWEEVRTSSEWLPNFLIKKLIESLEGRVLNMTRIFLLDIIFYFIYQLINRTMLLGSS